jgi:hypothetical protein
MNRVEYNGRVWVVYFNGKVFESFSSKTGAEEFLRMLEAPLPEGIEG